jgi:hypothetical protein
MLAHCYRASLQYDYNITIMPQHITELFSQVASTSVERMEREQTAISTSNSEPSTEQPQSISEADPVAVELWAKCLTIIRDNVTPQVYKTWFERIQALKWENNQFVIQVPSQFFYEWIEEHFYTLLQKTISQVMGAGAQLQYQVVVETSESESDKRTIKLPAKPSAAASTAAQNQLPFQTNAVPQQFPNFLNPNYVFENFIRGESNQLAAAAALAIAEKPGRTKYNPLVIYGNTGLGKTHLVQAIGNRALQLHRNLRVMYTNSERFKTVKSMSSRIFTAALIFWSLTTFSFFLVKKKRRIAFFTPSTLCTKLANKLF